ncbi:NDMA-dependent alcohol dehydrogenase [Geodermatophilus sp. SYSU D01186]
MKVNGAVIHAIGEKWSVEELELEEPRANEVLVKVMASGLCHSDDHLVTGDLAQPLPLVGGHEGAGVVVAVGEGVTRVKPGDHIATAYIPGCGVCDWCAQGMQFICDNGLDMFKGFMLDDTPRFHLSDGRGIGAMQRLGTFANYLVAPEQECIKIDPDIPFEHACLVACGVTTGWGSAVYAGGTRPGDVVVVLGTGGVGMNAIQGASNAGARMVVAVDPVPMKRELARQLGATDAFASIDEAMPAIHAATNGQGADVSIVTIGRLEPEDIAAGFRAIRKMGTCVVTAIGQNEGPIPIDPLELTIFAKQLRGGLFGNANPTRDIPRLLTYYKAGKLKLEELVTNTYRLPEINQAYDDLREGRNIRGVLVHEH